MSVDEAFGPISRLQRNIVVWGVVLILLVSLLSMLVSRGLVRPIDALASGVFDLSSGKEDVVVDVKTQDEFGALAQNFNTMVSSIREKSRLIDQQTQENERLMQNILPQQIMERLNSGETIADELQQVTIAYLQVGGLAGRLDAREQAVVLGALMERLEELGENYEVERIKTIGTTFVFGCGVTRTRLDHSKQTVDFAVLALDLLKRINLDHRVDLTFKIGIAAGPLFSAVVGSRQFHYEIWGPAADEAARIRFAAEPGTILVTEAVRQKMDSQHQVIDAEPLSMDGNALRLYQLLLPDMSLV